MNQMITLHTVRDLSTECLATLLWEPSMGTSQRLPKSVSKQQPDKQNFHDNQLSQQYINCCERCLYLGPPQGINRDIREDASVSQLNDSDQLARRVRSVQFGCSRGTFCKSQCNQRQEQVGENLSGKQPDQLSGFIGLRWTARPIERASVKINTPSSLPSNNAVSRLPLQSPCHRSQQPTSNIKSSASSLA
jgi:hypothetical protein